jgi:hypothetical protein
LFFYRRIPGKIDKEICRFIGIPAVSMGVFGVIFASHPERIVGILVGSMGMLGRMSG